MLLFLLLLLSFRIKLEQQFFKSCQLILDPGDLSVNPLHFRVDGFHFLIQLVDVQLEGCYLCRIGLVFPLRLHHLDLRCSSGILLQGPAL